MSPLNQDPDDAFASPSARTPATKPASVESTLTLIERAQNGDPAACELLARRYLSPLRRFAQGRLPAAVRGVLDTDDLVQVALTRTLSRIEAFEPKQTGSLLAYLRQAVLNQVRDEVRRVNRRPPHEELSDDIRGAAIDPLEETMSREALDRYEEGLRALLPDEQAAVLLRVEMGCGYREIAELIGRPSANAARLHVRRAIDRLSREIQRLSDQ